MFDIAVWTPVSAQSGFGHFYRMLGLYERLLDNGESVTYFTNENYLKIEDANIISCETQNLNEIISFLKKNGVKTIIIDNYEVTSFDVDILSKSFKTVCFDSQFYNNEIDIVMNFNPFALYAYPQRHKGTKYFLGLEYMPFRKKILQARKVEKSASDIFLSIGGSDVNEFTYSIIPYLPKEESYKIVLGKGCSAEYYNKVSDRLQSLGMKYTLYHQPQDFFSILSGCQYAISSCSTIVYELIYFAKPFVCVNVISNQDKLSSFLRKKGILILRRDNLSQIKDIIKDQMFSLPNGIRLLENQSLELINSIQELTHEN